MYPTFVKSGEYSVVAFLILLLCSLSLTYRPQLSELLNMYSYRLQV